MRVRSLRVAGCRSLADLAVAFGTVTVIVGANGSGKSNSYRPLRLEAACGAGRAALATIDRRGDRETLRRAR